MRSLEETRARWQATVSSAEGARGTTDLRRAVGADGPSSPCLTGCRSVCWKVFLLSEGEGPLLGCTQAVKRGREDYAQRRDHFLKFIEHPEALSELTIDPLADDPNSPWNTVRQDETIRAEIRQDVQRLPDETEYHRQNIQRMILDILFVYCKVHPDRGGYRQGMHELLAPIVHVVGQDAIDPSAASLESTADESMVELLDLSFVEHDAYVLFSRLMERAQVFYEIKHVTEPAVGGQVIVEGPEQRSTIVERSRYIHQVCLQKVDQELAAHLTSIEILPQIFLIRWIRLLFSREFPLSQFLVLWDTIFAIDPSLDLIDFICCAMLIRIRWQILEADYSVCLQLLLKYPAPQPPHGPHTFIDDAVFLRDHGTAAGGATLIERLLQQPGGVESLFQGAAKSAKGVLERGEKLGINQAVRDAMVEIRRNVQSFSETRQSMRGPKQSFCEDGAARALAAMERRNKRLAGLLDETVAGLKTISLSHLDDSAKRVEMLELAAARIQFVQVYLEDPSMEVPVFRPAGCNDAEAAREGGAGDAQAAEDTRDEGQGGAQTEPPVAKPAPESFADAGVPNRLEAHGGKLPGPAGDGAAERPKAAEGADGAAKEPPASTTAPPRRPASMPTRSTLAQSSFSWMLDPDESAPARASPPSGKSPQAQHRKKLSSNASRERNAFLFGELAAETDSNGLPKSDNIFGLEPIQKAAGNP